jgi:hypothetical protein
MEDGVEVIKSIVLAKQKTKSDNDEESLLMQQWLKVPIIETGVQDKMTIWENELEEEDLQMCLEKHSLGRYIFVG